VLVSTGAANLPARRLYQGAGFVLDDEITLPEGLRIARYRKELPHP
jgi:hypothetical protein